MTTATRNTAFLAEVSSADPSRAVGVIQSGLIARGHDLGPTGADEDAGPLTLAAWQAEVATPFRGAVSAESIAAVLQAVAPRLKDSEVTDWAEWLAAAAARYDITTPARIAAWLAQLAHESSGFTRLEESLNYTTAGRLFEIFPSAFTSAAAAEDFVRSPMPLAERVYGYRSRKGRKLGNTEPGDGFAFRGSGPTMLTGRANFTAAAKATGYPLVEHPELLREPGEVGAMVAAWYWKSRGCNELADRGNFEAVVKRIAGSLTGIADRRRLWERAKAAAGVAS